MQQDTLFTPVIRSWIFLIACMSVILIWAACQTSSIHDFSKVQMNMYKDDVLNIVGSPVRTERIDGKEKWAYKFWTNDDPRVESLRQVTFLNGRVVSVGEDVDEEQRLKEIENDDTKRAEKRKQFKARALSSDESHPLDPPKVNVKVIEEDFVEQKGKSLPIKESDDDAP